MKILVIGANGQLGSELCKIIQPPDLIPLTHKDIEVSDLSSVKLACLPHKPDVIINTAAFMDVDVSEDRPDDCFRVNALGAKNVAIVAQGINAKIIFISSDFVFGGESPKPARPYTEFDEPVPLSNFGRAKLAGENFVRGLALKHFVVRVSGLFGAAGCSGKGGNFVETMIRKSREGAELKVINDRFFSPTSARDAAKKIVALAVTEYYGTFHATNKGSCSWWEFAKELMRQLKIDKEVRQISAAEYPMKAKRPDDSVLENYHLSLMGLNDMPHWKEALSDYLVCKGYKTNP